jgi:hypothetical protein
LLALGCNGSPVAGGGGGEGGGGGGGDAASGEEGEEGDAAADAGGSSAPLTPGQTFKAKEKTLILSGKTTGPPPPAEGITRRQCGDLSDGGPVAGPGCITAEIECGQTIIGHTRGGVEKFNTRFWEKHFCTPATTNHNGGDERVYYLRSPEGRKRLWVTMDSPCADLDLAVIKYAGGDCPDIDANIQDCEMWPKPGHKREVVDLTSTGEADWLVVVEGKDEEEGAFAITVQCVDW